MNPAQETRNLIESARGLRWWANVAVTVAVGNLLLMVAVLCELMIWSTAKEAAQHGRELAWWCVWSVRGGWMTTTAIGMRMLYNVWRKR